MRSIVLLTAITCYTLVVGQSTTSIQKRQQRIVAQFEFTQIDSLMNNAIVKAIGIDSETIVVATSFLYPGSRTTGNTKFAAHSDHFYLYVVMVSKTKGTIYKVDNFSFFKTYKINASGITRFLNNHFRAMETEELLPKGDTTYNVDGSFSVAFTMVDHQLRRRIIVAYKQHILDYTFPETYAENKRNLFASRYKFLKQMDRIVKRYEYHVPRRKAMIYGDVF
ncbi:MAG: hypothetical protein U0T75_12280 [Chitinophagales bacterium]